MSEYITIVCKCGTRNRVHIADLNNKKDPDSSNKLLCCKCCKKVNYFSDKCKKCSDLTICKGDFKKDFDKWLSKIKGV